MRMSSGHGDARLCRHVSGRVADGSDAVGLIVLRQKWPAFGMADPSGSHRTLVPALYSPRSCVHIGNSDNTPHTSEAVQAHVHQT